MKNAGAPSAVRTRMAASYQSLSLCVVLFGAFTSVVAACKVENGFQCGTPLSSDPDIVRTCDRPREVCVCETSSCATRVNTSDCASGLRYTDEPFARSDLAGTCATLAQPAWIVAEAKPGALCPAESLDASAPTTDAGDASASQ